MSNQKKSIMDEKYYKYTYKKTLITVILFLILVLFFSFSLTCGSYNITIDDALNSLFSAKSSSAEINQILWNQILLMLRLSRSIQIK